MMSLASPCKTVGGVCIFLQRGYQWLCQCPIYVVPKPPVSGCQDTQSIVLFEIIAISWKEQTTKEKTKRT